MDNTPGDKLGVWRDMRLADALVFCLFGQRFLDNPRADSRQSLHASVLWFRMCLLPLFWLLRESIGNFCILAVFERVETMSADVPPPPVGSIGPWGRGEWELNLKKLGVVSIVHRTATISIFLSVAKCGSICRAQTYTYSGIEPSRSAKAFLQGGPKSSKKIRIFHHFETLRPYISETITNRGL